MEEEGGDSEPFGLSIGAAAATSSLMLTQGWETQGWKFKTEEEDIDRTTGHSQKKKNSL